MKSAPTCVTGSAFALLLSAPVSAQFTQRVSLDSIEGQQNGSSFSSAISADGRFVAFESDASDLVPGDTNATRDIFVRDRLLGTTQRVNVSNGGTQSNGSDFWANFVAISADGRFVAYETNASNLVTGDTNGQVDIFLRDLQLGTTERVSVDSAGLQSNGASRECSLSADGRYLAFRSYGSNLVIGDTNGFSDVFVRDRQSGTTERVSVDSGGIQGGSTSQSPAISADGRYVAFAGYGTALVPGDTNGMPDVFVHDRQNGTTQRVSVGPGGVEADGPSHPASMSADGRFVAFESSAANLVVGDNNGLLDAFVVDLQTGTTELVSVSTGGTQANEGILMQQFPSPAISADGRFVAFVSGAINLVPGDSNGFYDIFVRDRLLGSTARVSVDSEGVEANDNNMYPSISADGRFVSFASGANNLVGDDTGGGMDIFVHDSHSTGFTSLCYPGFDGVLACPCSNPPSQTGRGCDNSSATGGAILTAVGAAYLFSDSLKFTATGERPVALSIVTQWTGSNPSGSVFGMGVRCTSGTFRRLYTKQASGGSITAPDFGAGDPSVSARSATLGDTILPGDLRWYFVYYRDPNVLGGCHFTSTFNATQTGEVTWSF